LLNWSEASQDEPMKTVTIAWPEASGAGIGGCHTSSPDVRPTNASASS
jgi:hypothetical protein